jgi:hypothetical protein
MSQDAAPEPTERKLFAAVPERNTGDVILRTAQQHHVSLSVMADTKANIIITVSSIVLTLVLGQMDKVTLRPAMVTLGAFIMVALLLAVIAVLPKYRPLRIRDGEELPGFFNILFFGHFSELPRERFLEEMSGKMKADGSVYETMACDLYSMGLYLSRHKYFYLRLSYLFFLGGFVFACLAEAVYLLWH